MARYTPEGSPNVCSEAFVLILWLLRGVLAVRATKYSWCAPPIGYMPHSSVAPSLCFKPCCVTFSPLPTLPFLLQQYMQLPLAQQPVTAAAVAALLCNVSDAVIRWFSSFGCFCVVILTRVRFPHFPRLVDFPKLLSCWVASMAFASFLVLVFFLM